MVQVQTYPPAYFPPPLSSSWHRQLPSSSSESQLLLKSTQILREMLAGAGSDLSPPEPGRDRELKRTPSGRLADVASVSPAALGRQRRWDAGGHRSLLPGCPRTLHRFCTRGLVTPSPAPACGCKAASLGAGLVQSSLRASEGEGSPIKPPRYSG